MTRDARTTMESLERCFSLRIIKSRRPRVTSVNVFKNKSKLVEQGLGGGRRNSGCYLRRRRRRRRRERKACAIAANLVYRNNHGHHGSA